jgi:hypothetical protein
MATSRDARGDPVGWPRQEGKQGVAGRIRRPADAGGLHRPATRRLAGDLLLVARQHPSERPVGICASWRCRACGASIGMDRTTGAVGLDTSRPETIRALR